MLRKASRQNPNQQGIVQSAAGVATSLMNTGGGRSGGS
jgi:hypothetical protein